MVQDVAAHVVAHRLCFPDRPGQQVLQPVRAGVPGMLGDRPAVLALQRRDKPRAQVRRTSQRLTPGEPARDPSQRGPELRTPPISVYAVSRGAATGSLFHTSTEP